MSDAPFCQGCDQLLGIPEYDARLWDLYHRIDDGRQHREPLVYTQDDLEEAGFYDSEEDRDSVMHSMERSMHERGLCVTCGRPSMAGIDPSRILSEEDAQDLADMYAEQAAERRAGC